MHSASTLSSWTPPSISSTASPRNTKAGIIAGGVVGGFIVLIIIISLIVLLLYRRKWRKEIPITPFDAQSSSTASVRPLMSESPFRIPPSSLPAKQPIINEIMPQQRRPLHGESRRGSVPSSLVRSGRSNSHSSLRMHDHPYRGVRHIAELPPVPEAKFTRPPLALSHQSIYSESATQPSSFQSYEHIDINSLARHVASLLSAPGAADLLSPSDIAVPNPLESVRAKYPDMGLSHTHSPGPPRYTFPSSR
jgi:hypothetical protein